MDFSNVIVGENSVVLKDIRRFSLPDILDNGQCFRWNVNNDNSYEGIAFNKKIKLVQSETQLEIVGATIDDFENIWKGYFDLDRSYDNIVKRFESDPSLKLATEFAPGLRLLKQDPWESLASFILSQNNNIKRIKGLVERFCENFGDPIDGGFGFPDAERIASLCEEDLAPVRGGFRHKYLIDAAQKVASGEVSLIDPYTMPIDDAREHLMKIKGVGPKVANCVLLFGFHRIESLPVDVWVKRALEQFYPDGFPAEFLPVAGIAQQYLFHYIRLTSAK